MKWVFADTFHYLALLSPQDHAHRKAVEFTAGFAGILVTTDWVLTELADGLSARKTRLAVTRFVDSLREDPSVRIVPARRSVLDRGWNLYRRRLDKEWSLTDGISFVVMQRLKLTEAFTGDHHFEQAGFHSLLK